MWKFFKGDGKMKVICEALEGDVRIVEDGKYYNLEIGKHEIACKNLKDAKKRYSLILKAIQGEEDTI